MPTKKIYILIAALVFPVFAHAEETTITVKKSDTINLAVNPFAGSDATISGKVVANDLDLAGCFSVGIPERATYIVSGTASGGSLQGQVSDNRGGTILQKTYSGDTRTAAHRFADDIVETITGTPGIASSKLAFVSNRTGAKEIYLSDYDGANQRQITNEKAISVAPAISPNAAHLAYTGYQSGYADIYLIDLGTGSR